MELNSIETPAIAFLEKIILSIFCMKTLKHSSSEIYYKSCST